MPQVLRVLLVEDDDGDAWLVQRALAESERTVHEIRHVRRVVDAVDELGGSAEIDIVVSDLNLPDSLGNDTVTHLRGATQLPLVILTGAHRYDAGLAALEAGAQDYVPKGDHGLGLLEKTILFAIERRRVETELNGKNAALSHMAERDSLTGVLNHGAFLKRVQEVLSESDQGCALLFFDIDGFKETNDQYGHAVGDAVLKVIGQRLGFHVDADDYVGRVGGDEFAVLIREVADPDDVAGKAKLLVRLLAEEFKAGGFQLRPSASVGHAIRPDFPISAQELMSQADQSMDAGRRQRRQAGDRVLLLEGQRALELSRGIREDQLRVHYQPLWRLSDARTSLIGYEALARWDDPHRGMVSPEEFIGLAESHDLIQSIDAWVCHRAIGQLAAEEVATSGERLSLSVNFSAKTLSQAGAAARILGILRSMRWEPSDTIVEVTESFEISPRSTAARSLRDLRSEGVRVALDDFGTGYAGMESLRSLPLDIVKTDRSLLAGLQPSGVQSPQSYRFLRGLIVLVHEIGAEILAEGIETHAQLDAVKMLGFDLAQGYFLGRPQRLGSHVLFDHRVPAQRVGGNIGSAGSLSSRAIDEGAEI